MAQNQYGYVPGASTPETKVAGGYDTTTATTNEHDGIFALGLNASNIPPALLHYAEHSRVLVQAKKGATVRPGRQPDPLSAHRRTRIPRQPSARAAGRRRRKGGAVMTAPRKSEWPVGAGQIAKENTNTQAAISAPPNDDGKAFRRLQAAVAAHGGHQVHQVHQLASSGFLVDSTRWAGLCRESPDIRALTHFARLIGVRT